MKYIINALIVLITTLPVMANEHPDNKSKKWSITAILGSSDISENEVLKEINSRAIYTEEDVSNSDFFDLEGGIIVSYSYSQRWSSSFAIVSLGDYSSGKSCWILCDHNEQYQSSLTSLTHYYLTQNYSLPLWNNGFSVFKIGASLTSFKIKQEFRSGERNEFEKIYSSNENEWGGVAGIKITHIFADAYYLSVGHDKFTFLDSSLTYLEVGYIF